MKRVLLLARRLLMASAFAAALAISAPHRAAAFCGFYVGSADVNLYNHASQVAMVRDGDHNVLSIMSDYKGPMTDFAMVVPVPVVLRKEQIHIGDRALFDHLQSYSAPRLVEYEDPSPCPLPGMRLMEREMMKAPQAATAGAAYAQEDSLGVKIEAQYTVGEYDIVILSAEQSDGLEKWLIANGYKIPSAASAALKPYIRQDMKFFVAKVNLKEQAKTGLSYLRPIQFAFDSPKFMLPIRLGMVNAEGPQDLIVYALTRNGRVETTNYRTQELPSGSDLPKYVRDDFPNFYKALFDHQVKDSEMRTVFTEYAWNMSSCDPCAAPPLSPDELRALGVYWAAPQPGVVPQAEYFGPQTIFLTRLHVRYSATTFPEDLVFQETQDQRSFQARYVFHREWQGSPEACSQARGYFDSLNERHQKEAENLAELTGWDLNDILHRMGVSNVKTITPWWGHIWQ